MKKTALKTARKIVPILGIKVDSASKGRVLTQLILQVQEGSFMPARLAPKRGEKPFFVVTPNPEIILRATRSQELARILNSAHLAIPDGVGLKLAGVREIIPGRVLAEELVGEAGKRGMRVFLLGGKEGVAAEAAKRLLQKFQASSTKFQIQISNGPWLDENGRLVDREQEKIEKDTITKINKFKPHFLFVGFGPPKQEFWLSRNLPRLKVKVAMTVGGAFDYWAGKVPIPPKLVSQAGFEWLWRLFTQPWRAGRIFNAVIIFPLKLIWYRLTH